MIPRPLTPTLFPYTTLFRSARPEPAHDRRTSAERLREAAREQPRRGRSEEHTSELQSPCNIVCRLLLEKKKGAAGVTAHRSPEGRRHHDAPAGIARETQQRR